MFGRLHIWRLNEFKQQYSFMVWDSQKWCWLKFKSCGKLHFVYWYIVTNISQPKLGLCDSEGGGSMLCGNYLPIYMVEHPSGLEYLTAFLHFGRTSWFSSICPCGSWDSQVCTVAQLLLRSWICWYSINRWPHNEWTKCRDCTCVCM